LGVGLPVSVLNLAPIREGQTAKDAIEAMVRLARETEKLGYLRYWIAEHHNAPALASTATVILIKHVLENTERIRVGSGGIMLPNHSPLIVAEQFGTLAVLYPGRVDLGLGRAPGTDMQTANAIRRSRHEAVYMFPEEVRDLLQYFGPEEAQGYVRAYPAPGTRVPLYILGSSTESAVLAADLGLPYAFAAHFAPEQFEEAVYIYRNRFKPSEYLESPYMIAGLNVTVADTDEEAGYLFTTSLQFSLNVVRGRSQLLKPPVEDMDALWSPMEKMAVMMKLRMAVMGGKASVREQLGKFQEMYGVDEIMAVTYIFDEEKQVRSYALLKEIADSL